MQVVTPENNVEFITTGKVAEFKPPEQPKTDAKPDAATADKGAAPAETKVEAKPKDEPPRDADGKFVKAGDDKPAVSADADADEDAKLTEKIQRIIAKKHRQMKEAEEFATGEGRRAIEAERRAEQLQREIDALRGTKSEGPDSGKGKSDPDEPKPDDFKTVGEYTRALTKYEVQKAAKEARETNAQTKQQEQASEQIRTFAQRQDEFRKSTPDYDDVVRGLEDDQVHPVVMQYIVESEVGPALLNHLAKTPSEILRLRKLSPTRQVAELGKLEIKFEPKPGGAPNKADPAAARPEVSKAPAPISPLEGKEATVNKDPSQMTLPELREFRRKEAIAKAAR